MPARPPEQMCLPNYTKRLAQSQSRKLSEDKHKLAAEMTLGLCLSIRASGWQGFGRKQRTRFTAKANHAGAAVCPICFPGNRCILEVRVRKPEKNTSENYLYRMDSWEGKKALFCSSERNRAWGKTPKCAHSSRRTKVWYYCNTYANHTRMQVFHSFFINSLRKIRT